MKRTDSIIEWLLYIVTGLMWVFLLLYYNPTTAQNVVKQGNVFVQKQHGGDSIPTGYYYQDLDGNKYPIFLSQKHKAYAWVRSKKTGKMYKKYLPKITKALNDEQHK